MASGLPVLLSNACGCRPELIEEGVNGFSFDPKNKEEMAHKMISIAQHDLQKMGLASRQRIEDRFAPSSFGDGLASALEQLIV